MPASHSGSEYPLGTIRVVPETAKIVALCLEGDFDLTNAATLDAQIDLALDRGNDLILDLSEASFIDSTVIHLVARAAQTALTTEQTVVLQLGTAAIVERVLEVSGIEEVLPRAHDRQEALLVIGSMQRASSQRESSADI